MEIQTYHSDGSKGGMAALPGVFQFSWNPDLVHQVVTAEAANLRQGTAHAKGRGEVRGGGRKPWRQKGTGRARHGSIRSPLWKGGGVTHGPLSERNFDRGVTRKMSARALAAVLARKARDGELFAIAEDAEVSFKKTRDAAAFVASLGRSLVQGLDGKRPRALVLLGASNPMFTRAFRNLPSIQLGNAATVGAREALSMKYILLFPGAMRALADRLGKLISERQVPSSKK